MTNLDYFKSLSIKDFATKLIKIASYGKNFYYSSDGLIHQDFEDALNHEIKFLLTERK